MGPRGQWAGEGHYGLQLVGTAQVCPFCFCKIFELAFTGCMFCLVGLVCPTLGVRVGKNIAQQTRTRKNNKTKSNNTSKNKTVATKPTTAMTTATTALAPTTSSSTKMTTAAPVIATTKKTMTSTVTAAATTTITTIKIEGHL